MKKTLITLGTATILSLSLVTTPSFAAKKVLLKLLEYGLVRT